jgi:hypothetical protein
LRIVNPNAIDYFLSLFCQFKGEARHSTNLNFNFFQLGNFISHSFLSFFLKDQAIMKGGQLPSTEKLLAIDNNQVFI